MSATAQLSFLPKIDRKETQRRVEEALETVCLYRMIGCPQRDPKHPVVRTTFSRRDQQDILSD
jgi:hypothetical protein